MGKMKQLAHDLMQEESLKDLDWEYNEDKTGRLFNEYRKHFSEMRYQYLWEEFKKHIVAARTKKDNDGRKS